MRSLQWPVFVLAALVLPACLEAQATGGGASTPPGGTTSGGGATTGGGRGTTTAPTGTSTTPTAPAANNPTYQPPRSVPVSGIVVTENGTPPPAPVAIQLLCAGSPATVGYSAGNGTFAVDLAPGNTVIWDASQRGDTRTFGNGDTSANGRADNNSLAGCELRLSLAGFIAPSINLNSLSNSNSDGLRGTTRDLGTIVLRQTTGDMGYTVSATTAMAPKAAKKALDKGMQLGAKDKFAQAQKEFETAIALYPKFAMALSALGSVKSAQNDRDGAMEAWKKAVEADRRYITPHLALMRQFGRESNWLELERESAIVIQLNPVQYPDAYYLNSVANYSLHVYEKAEKSAQTAIQLDTEHKVPRAEFVLGVLQSMRHDDATALVTLKGYASRVQGAELEAAQKQIAAIEHRTP